MNTQPQIITPNIDLPTIQVPVKSIEKKKAYIDQHDFHHNDIQIKTPRYEPDATDAYSLEEQLEKLALTGQLDIMKFNILIEAFLKNDASPLEIKDLLIFIISKDSDPLQLQSREKTVLFNQLFQLKPNIFTYSMLFKTMQIELKKTRNPILQKQLEDKYLSEANHYWYEILKQDNELIPNIIVLNQYISIYLQANQNSNALQLYREYLEKLKLKADRISLVNLERISYKLTQIVIQQSKKSAPNAYEMQRQIMQLNDINTIFLEYNEYEDLESNKDKYENLFKYYIEVTIQRYDIKAVLEISKLLYKYFGLNQIGFIKQAFTHFYMNVLNQQGSISKIINIYAEREQKSIQDYLLDLFNLIIDETVGHISNEATGESNFIQIVRIFMEQLQILFRYNGNWGIIEIFIKQLKSIPVIYKFKSEFLQKNKLEQFSKLSYPDIHTICLVVKCLIREKQVDQALKFTQLLKEFCITSDLNKNEMEGLKLNENMQLIQCFMDIKDKISYDINTFFLNGVIIELNSRQLYEHAIILFKWMDRNVVINHRPNTSTYNMMILVYGSMQQYAYAKEMFLQMQQQWHTLNNTESYLETFEEIMSSLQQKGGVRSRESSQQQNVKSNEQSESEDDNKSGTNSQFMGSPNTNETSNFKHASDAIQKHLNLRIPPANINSYVSMVNILSRQYLYNDILDVLSKVKESYQTAKHPLLIYDLEDQAPLYQSIIKNLLNSKNDQLKLKAVKFAIESLQKGQFIQDKLIYQDCQNYLQIQCEKKNCDEKKKNLRDSLQDLLNECNINFDELIGKSSKSSLKILTSSDGTRIKEWRRSSNLYSDKASYKREKETFSNSSLSRDYESDEYQKPIHQKQGYHQKQGTKFSRKSVSKTQDTNPHFTSDSSKFRSDQQLNFKIEEMVEEDSPVKVSQRNKMKLFEQKHEVTAKQSIKPLKFD